MWTLLTWATAMWRTLVLTVPATVMTVKTTMAFVSVTTVTAIAKVITVLVMILSADPTARRREVAIIALVRRNAGWPFAECYDCNLVHGYNITMSIDATMIP